MSAISLYDASTIHLLKWPENEEGELAKRYLLPLMQEGPESFILNAKTRLYVLTIDEFIVPISVNEGEYENSYLLSSYFIAANLKEKSFQTSPLIKLCSQPFINLFGKMLKLIKINKVVIINNWLLSTNIYPHFTKQQIRLITSFLKIQFPDHYLMFRSVHNYQNSSVFESLSLENYRIIPSRQIYLYDPNRKAELSASMRRKQKKDSNKISRSHYTVETIQTLSDSEIERLLELYRNIYVAKYTKYSPLYTKKYLQDCLTKKIIKFKVLKKNNQIYGVSGFLKKNGYLLIPFFGYDTSLPQEEGLYRMLSAVIMEEIEQENLISHQGSGAPLFKKWRGYLEEQEYVAIYDQHLSLIRRLFWSLGEKFSSKLQANFHQQEDPSSM